MSGNDLEFGDQYESDGRWLDDVRERSARLRPLLRRLDVAEMVACPPPRVPWVVDGLVVSGNLTVLSGREGIGKSMLATALAAGVSLGRPVAGLACRQGVAVVVDAENGQAEIHRRVKALTVPPKGVEYYEADGLDLRFYLADLEEVLAAYTPALLVLDSFRSLWSGDENDSREASATLDALRNLVRQYDVGTLLLHHTSKQRADVYRGSTAIAASAQLGFTLEQRPHDPDPDRVCITCTKCRPARKPDPRWIRFAGAGDTLRVEAAATPPPKSDAKPRSASVREELRPQVEAALSAQPRSQASICEAVRGNPNDRTVRRILDDLEAEGIAEHRPDGWVLVAGWQPPKGDLPPATPDPSPLTADGRPS